MRFWHRGEQVHPMGAPERSRAAREDAFAESWGVPLASGGDEYRCAGGCGKVAFHSRGKVYVVVRVWCEECYVRVYGEPAFGFVGFDERGFYWEMGLRREPGDDPPESTQFDSDTLRSG